MLVYIVAFNKPTFQISKELYIDITLYINDKNNDTHFIFNRIHPNVLGDSTVFAETKILSEDYEICELQAPYFLGNTVRSYS